MAEQNSLFTRDEKRTLAFMSLIQFCLIVDFMILMPLGPQLMRLFSISAQSFGLLVSAYTLGAGVMGMVASFYLDQQDRKKSILIFFMGFILGNLTCSVVQSYELLLIARFITGAFGGVVGSVIYAIVSDSIDIDRRSTALGIVMASFALASILGVPFCLFLSNHFGWHSAFLAIFFFGSILWASFFIKFPAMREHLSSVDLKELSTGVQKKWAALKLVLSDRNRVLALSFMALLILGHFSINPFLFPSVVSNAEIPEKNLPIVYLVGGTASIFASLLFGKLADRYGNQKVFAISAIASFIPIYWVTHLSPMPISYVVAAVTAFFVIMGGRLTPAMTMITATSTPENRGSFLSLVGSVQQLSAALAAFLSGSIVTRTESGKLLNFEWVGVLAIVFSVFALCVSYALEQSEESKTLA